MTDSQSDKKIRKPFTVDRPWKLVAMGIVLGLAVLGAFHLSLLLLAPSYLRASNKPEKAASAPKEKRESEKILPRRIELLTGEALLAELRKGGLILFTRHFHTDHRKWNEDPIKPRHLEMTVEEFRNSCDQQRPLTDYGRMRARLVGEAMRKLGIPIGKVYASPYCRAVEGATLLAGREPDDTPKELVHRGGKLTAEMMANNIKPYLSTPPEPGTNTLLMSHRPQMDDIHFIEEGQMFVFRPAGEGQFDMVGAIYDTDWTEALTTTDLLGARYALATLQGADVSQGEAKK